MAQNVILDEKKLFPRLCSFTGRGMKQGYIFNEGEKYAKTKEEAKKYVTSQGLKWQEEVAKIGTKDEWFYWTEWELEEDINFDADGNEYEKDIEGRWVQII